MSAPALAVLTRDLRVHDNPALTGALAAGRDAVVAFVLDEAILRSAFNRPNRARFLSESLHDLDASLRDRGSALVVRQGDWPVEVARLAQETGAGEVHVAGDVTGYARNRLHRLGQALAATGASPRLVVHDGALVVVPAGTVAAAGKDHMAVFTPYLRRWLGAPTREVLLAPGRLDPPPVGPGRLPAAEEIAAGRTSPGLPRGGETAGRARLADWLRSGVDAYAGDRDALDRDGTSRLSADLHFGCLSPLEVVRRAQQRGGEGAAEFVRQLAWRDFHHQVLAAHPAATRADLRPRGDRWANLADEVEAWRRGRTGYPIVDAGMRQLVAEGWMHNRARLIVGHFLTKTLYADWRIGAAHFSDWLVDADVANNTMNWQWVAGTGTDSRFNRTYNVVAQARRHDPRGTYVRRYVPELAGLDPAVVHEPWLLPAGEFAALGYPAPIVDQHEAQQRLRLARTSVVAAGLELADLGRGRGLDPVLEVEA